MNNNELETENKNCCRNCKYLSEDWCSGSGDLFCSHPKGQFFEDEFFEIDDCDFFESVKGENNARL